MFLGSITRQGRFVRTGDLVRPRGSVAATLDGQYGTLGINICTFGVPIMSFSPICLSNTWSVLHVSQVRPVEADLPRRHFAGLTREVGKLNFGPDMAPALHTYRATCAGPSGWRALPAPTACMAPTLHTYCATCVTTGIAPYCRTTFVVYFSASTSVPASSWFLARPPAASPTTPSPAAPSPVAETPFRAPVCCWGHG